MLLRLHARLHVFHRVVIVRTRRNVPVWAHVTLCMHVRKCT